MQEKEVKKTKKKVKKSISKKVVKKEAEQDKPRNKGGKPRIILTEEQRELVKNHSKFLTIKQLANLLGISEKTFFNIRDYDPSIDAIYLEEQAKLISFGAGKLIQAVARGEPWAIKFLLRTRGGYVEQAKVDVTSSDGSMTPQVNIQNNIVNNMSIEEEKEMLAEYQKLLDEKERDVTDN